LFAQTMLISRQYVEHFDEKNTSDSCRDVLP